MTPLRYALVGCGPRSVQHLEAVDACDGMEIVACADPAEPGKERFRQHCDKPVYDTMEELLKAEAPDFVGICTREQPRYDLTTAALEGGVRGIILEKPMARNVDQAREMVKLAAEKGVPLAVSHQMRFADEFNAARDAIRAGEIGEVYYVRASCYGQIMEQGTHIVDMILWLLDDPEVDWVMGSVADIEEGRSTVHPAPAFSVGYVAFQDGRRAVIESGRRFQRNLDLEPNATWLQKRAQVIGTGGMTDSVVRHHAKLMNREGGWRMLYEGTDGWDLATIRFYAEFGEVLRNGGEHRNNGPASLRGFEIMHAIYQSALTRDRVTLPIPPGAAPLEELMAEA